MKKSVEKAENNDKQYYWFALRIFGDFTFSLVVPVAIFAWLGNYLDNKYNTGPWLLIIGFVIAALVSAKIIYKKAHKLGKEFDSLDKKQKDKKE